jgi:hypothetical protein
LRLDISLLLWQTNTRIDDGDGRRRWVRRARSRGRSAEEETQPNRRSGSRSDGSQQMMVRVSGGTRHACRHGAVGAVALARHPPLDRNRSRKGAEGELATLWSSLYGRMSSVDMKVDGVGRNRSLQFRRSRVAVPTDGVRRRLESLATDLTRWGAAAAVGRHGLRAKHNTTERERES